MGGSVRRSRAVPSHAGICHSLPWFQKDNVEAKKRSRPTDREINTAVYMLRAKQMGLSIAELDQMEEGMVIDMIIEAGNDLCEDEYCQVADQHAFDVF
jgi:hypothetical protein